MKRRKFITLLGGAAWPLVARAQQPERPRRVGVLVGTTADDPIGQDRIAAFQKGLQQLGWTLDVNVRIDTRWAGVGDAEHYRRYAAELVALAPDVILASSGAVVGPLRRITRTVPVVFTETSDPVGVGFVESLARPGGNVTGFLSFEYGLTAKWLELLKEIAPGVTRVAVLRDPAIPSGPRNTATTLAKRRRNGRACGQQYLRSAICACWVIRLGRVFINPEQKMHDMTFVFSESD
jgi:ABC-type uncharacterized transport system substrate-binding protein